jgi:hypothetical protein
MKRGYLLYTAIRTRCESVDQLITSLISVPRA